MCVRQALVAYNYPFRLEHFVLPFLLQQLGKRPCLVIIYFFGAGVVAWSSASPWRSRPRVFLARVPCASLEYPALRCDLASRVFGDGLRFARIRLATHMVMFTSLDVTEARSYWASSGVLLTESLQYPCWRKLDSLKVTHTALNWFIMNCDYVESPSACLRGIVHPRVTQTRPMDASTICISARTSQKTGVYLTFNHFAVSRCDGTACVHERRPHITTVQAR